MKVREWIIKNEVRMFEDRLQKLEAMGAPAIMIDGQRKAVEMLKAGNLEISGETDLLEVEVEGFECKTGKGGKVYVQINGSINYFPQARYGRFISKAQ